MIYAHMLGMGIRRMELDRSSSDANGKSPIRHSLARFAGG